MNWVRHNVSTIVQRCVDHLALALPPIALCFIISVPLGWLANRLHRARGVLLTTVSLLYAIPSLPLFIILPALLGTNLRDPNNVIVALTLYGIALMVQSAAGAFGAVDDDVAEAATAIGFSRWSRFWRIELPLAGPTLIAGIRVVAVSTISLATVGAVLGVKSLGLLFTDGIQRNIPEEILAGIAATVAIALVIDAALVALGRLLMPWSRLSKAEAPLGDRKQEDLIVAVAS